MLGASRVGSRTLGLLAAAGLGLGLTLAPARAAGGDPVLRRPTIELTEENLGYPPHPRGGERNQVLHLGWGGPGDRIFDIEVRSGSGVEPEVDAGVIPRQLGIYERYEEMSGEALQEEIDRARGLLDREYFPLKGDQVQARRLLRLGVAYHEMGRYQRAQELRRYDRAMATCRDRGRDDCLDSISPDFERSHSFEVQAIRTYQYLVAAHPGTTAAGLARHRLRELVGALEAG